MIERSDFTGLIFITGIWYVLVQKSSIEIFDLVSNGVKAMIGSSIYDFIWLIFHYSVRFIFKLGILV